VVALYPEAIRSVLRQKLVDPSLLARLAANKSGRGSGEGTVAQGGWAGSGGGRGGCLDWFAPELLLILSGRAKSEPPERPLSVALGEHGEGSRRETATRASRVELHLNLGESHLNFTTLCIIPSLPNSFNVVTHKRGVNPQALPTHTSTGNLGSPMHFGLWCRTQLQPSYSDTALCQKVPQQSRNLRA
jgi:hypothetical protein